jgi:hypothetical protein
LLAPARMPTAQREFKRMRPSRRPGVRLGCRVAGCLRETILTRGGRATRCRRSRQG